MPNQQGWPPGQYGAYQNYASPAQMYQYHHRDETQYPPQPQPQPQLQQQNSMVVMPQQPRRDVQQTPQLHPTSARLYQPAQPQYHGPPVPQYAQPYQPPYQTSPPPHQTSLAQVPNQSLYYQSQVERPRPSQSFNQPDYGQVQQHLSNPANAGTYMQPSRSIPLQQATPRQATRRQSSPQNQGVTTVQPVNHHQASRTPQQPHPIQQVTPQQRTVAHVRIPVYRPEPTPVESPMPRMAKRRRSNDNTAIPVCDAPQPQNSHVQQGIKQETVVSSSPLTELASSQMPPTLKIGLDYQAVLLRMSDEYITEAYSMSHQVVSSKSTDEQLERYQSLMAMGMGCLESVLRTYRRLNPRKEARIRLRLASLLHEETDNIDAAEEILSKGISLCERSKLTDLKFTMQHLLARILFDRSPKAAAKSIEKLISDTGALGLIHWNYAFRFLQVTLTLRVDGSDTAVTLRHLAAISSCAEDQRHVAVCIVAAAMEAMVHLRSGSTDAVDLAQRALAAARTHQLGSAMQKMPQMRILLEFLDYACGMLHFGPDQMAAKLLQMHETLDATTKVKGWAKDGRFALPLGVTSHNNVIEEDTASIFTSTVEAEVILVLQWLSASQIYELGYVLSGSATMHKNAENGKAESYLREGVKMIQNSSAEIDYSISAAASRAARQSSLTVNAHLQLAFAYCGSSNWNAVEVVLREAEQDYAATAQTDDTIKALVIYLKAVCKHAAGDVEAALSLYSSPALVFRAGDKRTSALRDIQVLAGLSSIVILRADDHNGVPGKANELMSRVQAYCLTHHEQAFVAAWHTLKATSDPDMPIIKTKQFLQSAVKAGRAVNNQRLLCVIMNTMTQMYFSNIVGDQAEKSARAGRSLALKTKDKLWLAVADGMFASTSELCGKNHEAKAARDEAREAMATLPKQIKQHLAGRGV